MWISSAPHNEANAILAAALHQIPSTGFTRQSIVAANPSLPQHTLEALFPSSPQSTLSSRLFRQAPYQSTGPEKALLQYWLDEQRKIMLEAALASEEEDRSLLRDGLHHRLSLNEPLLPELKRAIPLLLGTPVSLPLSDRIGYSKHASQIAGDLSHAAFKLAQGVTVLHTAHLMRLIVYRRRNGMLCEHQQQRFTQLQVVSHMLLS